ncbi:hypothetical protein COOONC_13420 [Cooperia oncophora]
MHVGASLFVPRRSVPQENGIQINVPNRERRLSPLHQAIVNEDVEMVYFLCKKGADVHQRCYGSFFCADDQKASRTDSLEHEWVDLVQNTRYTGQMYWGELPLSFAACTNNQVR